MQTYSAVDYWTPAWIYPRSRLRERFPRRRALRHHFIFEVVPPIPVEPVGKIYFDAIQPAPSGFEAIQVSFSGFEALQ